MRPINALSAVTMRGVVPATPSTDLPKLTWVSPVEVFVEDDYQRSLSERSIAMIRKIVAGWRWAHIKPVICARVGGKLMAIDGQHTSIAAATLGIPKIPAMVVTVSTVKERAAAFIGQNCDRLNLTAAHIHYASLAAGEEIAVAVDQACRKAGVRILRHSKGAAGSFKIGETFTVGLIHRIVKRHGVNYGVRVLKVLVDAKRAPLDAAEIAAVDILLREPAYKGRFDTFDLVTALRGSSPEKLMARAARRMADKGIKRRLALAEVLFSDCRKAAA